MGLQSKQYIEIKELRRTVKALEALRTCDRKSNRQCFKLELENDRLKQEIELLKCENESLGHWNKKLRGEAK